MSPPAWFNGGSQGRRNQIELSDCCPPQKNNLRKSVREGEQIQTLKFIIIRNYDIVSHFCTLVRRILTTTFSCEPERLVKNW